MIGSGVLDSSGFGIIISLLSVSVKMEIVLSNVVVVSPYERRVVCSGNEVMYIVSFQHIFMHMLHASLHAPVLFTTGQTVMHWDHFTVNGLLANQTMNFW